MTASLDDAFRTAKTDYRNEIDPDAVVLVQVLVPLWCSVGGNATFDTHIPCHTVPYHATTHTMPHRTVPPTIPSLFCPE